MDIEITDHARRRLAQRNLSSNDIDYVLAHGRMWHAAKARFVHLGWRDIPAVDRLDDRRRRLEGTVLVLVHGDGWHLATAYRNRERGFKTIKHKEKRSRQDGTAVFELARQH